ncbi:hypothetical protein TRFO_36172 [Tritrichomonas foetus]|uniref:Uncharacterized protein n=1 Tax=Tritrichomonas foetus TaxID=1144522 RepID=A0A1J4JFY8_9EUKA|nr:hypothetical protein TRFO_36172 [Tritrichomonas foetus]|eukprot:OHS97569.1 hypothetical protein TRFO_36172 [Tritrichomonas foetus]
MKVPTANFLEFNEVNYPMTAEEERLLSQNIKPCYLPQVKAWVYCQRPKHKNKLFSLLKGLEPKNSKARPITSFSPHHEVVIESSSCRIDLTSFLGIQSPTRRLNVNRFASNGIIGDKIFGDCKAVGTPRRNEGQSASLAQFILKKIIKPERLNGIIDKSEGYLSFLEELNNYIEKKANNFPIDTLRSHPTLNPDKERRINNRRNREDHLTRNGAPPHPHEVRAKPKPRPHPYKTPTSAYTDFFSTDPRYTNLGLSMAFPPFEQSQPFCIFPEASQQKTRQTMPKFDPKFIQQAKEDSITNRNYKKIFNSKTIL